MLKANQLYVAHSTNINLVALRNFEINYFNQFFTNFGTQCALICGFLLGSITQVPGLGAECHPFWIWLYWISTAICFVGTIHVLICTVYISVFGQGLALRGPLGSMIRAIDGMIIEQNQILYAFIISIASFGFSTIGTYWIMMKPLAALISTVVTLFGMVCWHHYSLRIFNRFQYVCDSSWRQDGEDQEQALNLVANHPNLIAPTSDGNRSSANNINNIWKEGKHKTNNSNNNYNNNNNNNNNRNADGSPSVVVTGPRAGDNEDELDQPLLGDVKPGTGMGTGSRGTNKANKKKSMTSKVAHWVFRGPPPTLASMNPFGPSVSSPSNIAAAPAACAPGPGNQSSSGGGNNNSSNHDQNVMYAGFITIKLGSSKMFSKPWRRVFAVVTVTGTCSGGGGGSGSELTYYHDQRTWLDHPEAPLRKRPVELEGMALHVASEEPPFDLVLSPADSEDDDRAHVELRCDTVTELATWMEVFARAIQLANTDNHAGNVGQTTVLTPPESDVSNRGFAL